MILKFAGIVAIVALGLLLATPQGYTLMGPRWETPQVAYYVDPQNDSGLTPEAIVAALQIGASAWTQQTTSPIALVFSGLLPAGSGVRANNGRNEILFRRLSESSLADTRPFNRVNLTTGAAELADADIIFNENRGHFIAGQTPCLSSSYYVEDIALHEFGHVLGLMHSEIAGAAMQPYSYPCAPTRTLQPDDLAAMAYLYPPAGTPPPVQLACAPRVQTVIVGQPATLVARGSVGPYTWLAPTGVPQRGTGPTFSPVHSNSGSSGVLVTTPNGQAAMCTVIVVTTPSLQPPQSTSRPVLSF